MHVETELHVPADAAFCSLLRSFVDDARQRVGFPPDSSAFTAAVERCFRLLLEDASVRSQAVRVVARCYPHVLDLSLIERGLPRDDAFARRDPHWSEVSQHVDAAHWIQHGVHGSELRLRAYRDGVPVAREPEGADTTSEAEVALAPAQAYTIRPYAPEDGAGIARCFFESWGYHYPLKAIYVPAQLERLNASGALHSFVAVGEDGEVAGHYGLRPHSDAPIAEGCAAAVLPAHRGRALMERLRAFAEAAAPALGFSALYFEPVTDHVFTQRANESDGAHLCGISLGISPAGVIQPGMALSTTSQRQSLMLYLKSLGALPDRTVYAPARHRAMIERIYQGLGMPCAFKDAPDSPAPAAEGRLRAGIDAGQHCGEISIESIGPETAAAALQALEDLRGVNHLAAIFVELPLADPATPQLCEAFEAAGCSFAGIGPWMLGGGDALRLQRIDTPLDCSKLAVFSPFGRELLAYIDAERARVTDVRS